MSNMPPPPPGGPPSGPPPGAPPPPPGMPAPPPGQGGPQLYQPPPPSYGAPPPIAQPQYGQPQYTGAKTNTLAIISLVASLVWVCGLGSIAAVITGFMARKQIRQSGGRETGDGLALAGIIIGCIGVVGLVGWLLIVVGIAASDNSSALHVLAR